MKTFEQLHEEMVKHLTERLNRADYSGAHRLSRALAVFEKAKTEFLKILESAKRGD